jgi:hypothetical protein
MRSDISAKIARDKGCARAAGWAIVLLTVWAWLPHVVFAAPPSAVTDGDTPFPRLVPNFVPLQAGEHPRLFFRKVDLPALRKRAATPEGKAIVARLKALLGGGEAMPALYNPATKSSNSEGGSMPMGTYTLWHGAGFGMLYQLSGDKKYADLGRQCVEKAFAGQRDWDDRYAWVNPGNSLRMAAAVSAIAMAYDLCYDGWNEAFRKTVSKALLQTKHRIPGGALTVEQLALEPPFNSKHNHWGSLIGGAGLVLLSVQGDPDVGQIEVQRCLDAVEKNTVAALTQGFGDHGYFWEHPAPSGVASLPTLVPMLQAMRVAAGRDYISPKSNGPWVTLRWAMWLVPRSGKPFYPNPNPTESYGEDHFVRAGMITRGGHFSQGFGAITDDQKPALLWVYRHFVEPGEAAEYPSWLKPGEKSFDALDYPHHAVLALINWPIGIAEKNPEEVLPKAVGDDTHGFYVFRNHWRDDKDIIVSALLGARPDKKKVEVSVWGEGERVTFGAFPKCRTTYFHAGADGSGILSGGGNSLAVDYSGTSGAEALIVMVGPDSAAGANSDKIRATTITAGHTTFQVMTVQTGPAPVITTKGDQLLVGKQAITFDGHDLALGEFRPRTGG